MRIDDITRKAIQEAYRTGDYSYADLSRMFGVSSTSIGRIVNPDYQIREREKSKIRQRTYKPSKAAYSVNLRFYETEGHLIRKLKSVYNIQQYIKDLIDRDIKKTANKSSENTK